VDLSKNARREDPNCPVKCISYLAFKGPGYKFSFGTFRGEPARLFLASIRIDKLVHTLAIVVDAPTRKIFDAVLPAATAIVGSLKVAAVAAPNISALSTFCTPVFFGTCRGELAAGQHASTTFSPRLTYTVPVGWTNFTDHPGVFGLVPPGGDWQAVDSDNSDYLDVIANVATARPGCAEGASTIRTPSAFVRWLEHEPGLAVSRKEAITVGGLSGFVVDIRMRASWAKTCPGSHEHPSPR